MKKIKPLFTLNPKNIGHFCLQEAILSSVIITCYMILNDLVNEYILIDKQLTRWKKYLMAMIIMFIATFVSIMIILMIFGYKC